MRIHRGFLGWGVFLLVVGAIPLAVRAGYLTDDQIGRVGSLWPLILIGIGIGVLLGRTRFAFLGGILVAATFGVMVGGVLSGGVDGLGAGACGPGGGGLTGFPSRDGTIAGASASVELELNCGDLTLTVAPGEDWRVEGEAREGTAPDVDAEDESLRVSSPDGGGWLDGLDDRETWRITLPGSARLAITMDLNAGSSTM